MSKKIFYWLPRVLSIGFVLFLSLFALDVFSDYQGWDAALPLLMHLLPSLVLLGLIAIAWKYDLAGTIIFFTFAGVYIWTAGLDRHWSWYAAISGPAVLVGILFFLSWLQKNKSK